MNTVRRNKQKTSKNKLTYSLQSKKLQRKSVVPHLPTESSQQRQLQLALKPIYNLNDNILIQTVDSKGCHEALHVLHQIEASIVDCKYECNKKIMHFHLSIFYNNKSFVLSELEQQDQSAKMMEKSLKHHQTLHFLLSSREEKVAYLTDYVKMSLKYCAILSNSKRHSQAIPVAQKALLKISEGLLLLNDICQQHKEWSIQTPQTIATEVDSRVKSQKVNFKKVVIRQAQKILREVQELPSSKRLLGDLREHFEQKMKNMYFWKNNADNNAKNIRKQLFQHPNSPGQRNLLGLQKSSTFIQQFSLSEVMSLDLMKMKAKVNSDPYFLLSSPKIIQLLLLASICYFTIATQTRFNDGNLDISILKISQKYRKLKKDEILGRCKILHLKAIELAGKYLSPQNDFFIHLLNSFNKNYKCVLDQITEQSEISKKSICEQINETYYHRLVNETKLDERTISRSNTKRRKQRLVSKDRILTKQKTSANLKKKQRCISKTKKVDI